MSKPFGFNWFSSESAQLKFHLDLHLRRPPSDDMPPPNANVRWETGGESARRAYLHWFLSSKLENPGMPDRPVCDDEWFVTYGYILLLLWDAVVAGDDGLPSELVNGLPSDVDVVNAELLLWFWLLVEELLLLLLFNDATDDDNCELINGWNCVYFGSILSNRNFDIARGANPKKTRNVSFWSMWTMKAVSSVVPATYSTF